uniref:PH domain-containing protein n=1 Tax=Rhabditophanes sp. KR3021 TaxID=114890 RepID=A0AC35U4Y6_9BILA
MSPVAPENSITVAKGIKGFFFRKTKSAMKDRPSPLEEKAMMARLAGESFELEEAGCGSYLRRCGRKFIIKEIGSSEWVIYWYSGGFSEPLLGFNPHECVDTDFISSCNEVPKFYIGSTGN